MNFFVILDKLIIFKGLYFYFYVLLLMLVFIIIVYLCNFIISTYALIVYAFVLLVKIFIAFFL
jgi:hypothetical protein